MVLPKNERRTLESIPKKVFWIYGQPYTGKTYLANTYPDVLMLNTDGNVKFIDAPYVAIREEHNGRIVKSAWKVFKDTLDDLASSTNHGFKTLVVDLLEDTYQFCRQDVLEREGYTHESDGGFGKGWSLVADEFVPTIKKLIAMDFENIILISHEVTGDISKKNGDKITTIIPNIRDKIALKISGMVDFTGRLTIDDNGERIISIKPNETIFGGGRAGFVGQSVIATKQAIDGLYAPKPSENTTEGEKVPSDPIKPMSSEEIKQYAKPLEEINKRQIMPRE